MIPVTTQQHSQYNYCMKQLFTFNSQQFASHIKPSPDKRTIPVNCHHHNTEQQDCSAQPSKKRMKRSEQIMEIANRHALKEQENQAKTKDQLRGGIVEQFSSPNYSMNSIALKLLPKKMEERNKRCNSEMSVNNHDSTMLFTFYPNQNNPNPTLHHNQSTQEIDLKRTEGRSFSLKKSPIISYPISNAVLPKLFRIKSGGEEMPRLHKRQKNLSDLPIQTDHNKTQKQLNRNMLIRNYPTSCLTKNKTELDISIGKLQLPSKLTLPLKRAILQRQ